MKKSKVVITPVIRMVSFDSNWEWIDGLLARGGGGGILFLGEGGDNVRFSLIFIVSIFASRSTGNAECRAVPQTCFLTDLQVIAVHIKVSLFYALFPKLPRISEWKQIQS